MRLQLLQTCGACPEQYDVYCPETKREVGYLRLRHGCFYAEYTDEAHNDHVVYEANPAGDGQFEAAERVHHLNAACRAIEHAMQHGVTKLTYETEPIYDSIEKPPE